MTPEELAEAEVDFCIGKCGEGYCTFMTPKRSKGDFPCLEYICFMCKLTERAGHSCSFCKGELFCEECPLR